MYARPSVNALGKQARASKLGSDLQAGIGSKSKKGLFGGKSDRNLKSKKKEKKHNIITEDAEAFSF
jgi:hypothetical protein